METRRLEETAQALVAGDRGLLAMDESTPTCKRRFAPFGIPQTPEMRRAYRDMIVTTPRLGECISGAILYDETIRQPALEVWRGEQANVTAAQRALFHRADCSRAARRGEYDAAADAPKKA